MGPVPECATLCMPAETVGDIRKDSSFRTVTGSSPGRACGEEGGGSDDVFGRMAALKR